VHIVEVLHAAGNVIPGANGMDFEILLQK
jgi:hypothetical protein